MASFPLSPPPKRPSDSVQHLEPKQKEHQRKKILRTFFSWKYRQPMKNAQEARFWSWVKSINPDNSASEDRYKSISSEFLDKLLDKEMFRRELGKWLGEHESSLVGSDDSDKTSRFVQFLKDSIEAKDLLDQQKREFLQSLPPLHFPSLTSPPPGLFKDVPDSPGLYFEAKCKQSSCRHSSGKGLLYIGSNGAYDYMSCRTVVRCSGCRGELVVSGLGFHCCRWALVGVTGEGEQREEACKVAWRYTSCDEASHIVWRSLLFRVAGLSPEEYSSLQTILLSSVEEHSLKKRPKPAEVAYRLGTSLSLEEERERLDLAATLEQRNREVREATHVLTLCQAQLAALHKEAKALSKEIAVLKGRPRIE